MDGQFDYRWSFPESERPPAPKSQILVDGQWRAYEQEGDTRYVDLDGVRTPLKLRDGVWRIVEQPSQESQ